MTFQWLILALPDGEKRFVKSQDEILSLENSVISQSSSVSLFLDSEASKIEVRFSREEYLLSGFEITSTVRNDIHLLGGIVEDFQVQFSAIQEVNDALFVSFTEDEALGRNMRLPAKNDSESQPGDPEGALPHTAINVRPISRRAKVIPQDLPYAKIFLDDLIEISRILIDGYQKGAKPYQPEPSLIFKIGDDEFASLQDLETRGGETHNFAIDIRGSEVLRVSSFNSPEVRLWSLDDDLRWTIFAQIQSIFDSRQYKLKNALFALPIWTKGLAYVVWFMGLHYLPNTTPKIAVLSFITYMVVTVLLGFELTRRSTVVFALSHRKNNLLSERRQSYLQNLGFTMLGACLSPLVQAIWDHFRSSKK